MEDLLDFRSRSRDCRPCSGPLRKLGRQPATESDFEPLQRVTVSAADLFDNPSTTIGIELMVIGHGANATTAQQYFDRFHACYGCAKFAASHGRGATVPPQVNPARIDQI